MSRRKSGSKSASMVSTWFETGRGEKEERTRSRLRLRERDSSGDDGLLLVRLAFDFPLHLFLLPSSHLGRLDLEREVVGDALNMAREHVVGEELHRRGSSREKRVAARFEVFETFDVFCGNSSR